MILEKCGQVLKAKYFPHDAFMHCRKKKNCLRVWPAILNTRNTLSRGLCFKVGRGNNINFWEDPWVPNLMGFKPIPKNEIVRQSHGMVHSLLGRNGEWKSTKLNELFNNESVKRICEIFWVNMEKDDILVWLGNRNGAFSVKSFYWMENWDRERQAPWWKNLWNSNIHERHKFFVWKLVNRGLSVKQNLIRRGIQLNEDRCVHGCPLVESEVHLLLNANLQKDYGSLLHGE